MEETRMAETKTEPRAKYSSEERDKMAKSGAARSDGSYPIADEADLKRAIRSVGRGGADHDAIRAHVIERAKAIGLASLLPDNWNADGSLKESKGAWGTLEERETYNDLMVALDAAVSDEFGGEYSYSCWVQDLTDSEVIFREGGDLWSAPYTVYADGDVVLGARVKVRPVTEYVERAGGQVEKRSLVEWRKSKADQLRGLERRRFDVAAAGLEMREKDDDTWTLSGFACVTDEPYQVGFYEETVRTGAFRRTLSENPDVQLLINHEGLPLARTRSGTMTLEERTAPDDLGRKGLWVQADLDKLDPDAQRLQRKMARGDVDGMSFAFQATDDDWSDDYTKRSIRSASIHRGDVSVVNQGANPLAAASIRSADALAVLQRTGPDALYTALVEWRNFTLIPMEERQGKTLSASTTEVLTNVLAAMAASDEQGDQAIAALADLLGVPNPDSDDEESEAEEPASDSETATRSVPDYTRRAAQMTALWRAT
jgi:HK97 family phage prohead protease